MKNKNYFFLPYANENLGFVKYSRSKCMQKYIVYENNKKTFSSSLWFDVDKYIQNKYGNRVVFGGWTD